MKSRLVIVGVIIALLGAIAHAYQFAIEWRALQPVAGISILISPFFTLLQMFMVASFLVSAIGLLTQMARMRIGLVVSIIGLLCVLLGHIEWYVYTKHTLPDLERELLRAQRPDMIPPHPFGLIGARWWDIAILFCSAILLVWEVKALFAPNRTRSISRSTLAGVPAILLPRESHGNKSSKQSQNRSCRNRPRSLRFCSSAW